MENRELIKAIGGMLKGELEPIHEEISKVKDRLTVLEIKEQATHKRFNDLTLSVKIAERDTRRDIVQANDTIETLITILEAKDMLSKAL